jgi:hypothetical protein
MEQEKCNQKQNSDKTKKNPKKSPQKTQNPQKQSNSNFKKQNNQIELLTKPQKPHKKKQVFPKHTTNLETLKLSLTQKISSIQNYTKP